MAVTEVDLSRPFHKRRSLLKLLVSSAAIAWPARAWGPDDPRAVLAYLSSALANSNPSDALSVFSKNCPAYGKLVEYFSALTRSYEITSEVEITGENTEKDAAELEANWAMTLTGLVSSATRQRRQDVKIRLSREQSGKGKSWKIVNFTPVDLFNPQLETK